MTLRPPLVIAGNEIGAGRRVEFEIPVARLPTDTTLSLPVVAIHGRRPGPTIWLSAAVHGDEICGVEIIRRVLSTIKAPSLAGSVIAVPIVNVFGFVIGSRYLPDRRDLNRSFPGSKRGSLASRIANIFVNDIMSHCSYGIDLHTGSDHRINLPQIRARLDDPETLRIAKAFGAPAIVHSPFRDGSLRETAARRGIHTLVFEGGEAHRFSEAAVDAGSRGVLRVLAALEMWDNPEILSPGAVDTDPVEVFSSKWVRARRSGILRLESKLGWRVEKGDLLGVISDATGSANVPVKANMTGLVIGHTQHPLVSQGDALFHIADVSGEHTGRTAQAPRQ